MIKINVDPKTKNIKIDTYAKDAIGFYGSSDFCTYVSTVDKIVAGLSAEARAAFVQALNEEPAFESGQKLFDDDDFFTPL